MNANKTLLQMKYARVIALFAKKQKISYAAALDFFYKSVTYKLISGGVSDMHCMSDDYLADELVNEYGEKTGFKNSD